MAGDPYDLARFLAAQQGIYAQALAELRRGRKESHWMWFVFPQAEGLGSSRQARHYAINSRAEGEAYLAHPVLGARLRECAEALLALPRRPVEAIFPPPDDLKLKSSLTLFATLAPDDLFARVLARYFAGERCAYTLSWLAKFPAANDLDAFSCS